MVKKRLKATELLAQLQKDPEYVRRRKEVESNVRRQMEEMHRAEAPLVAALHAAGTKVETVWDLVNTRAQYPDALPILFEHLQRPYPDSVRTGIAGALAVPASKRWWKQILAMFQASQELELNGFKTALAATLVGAADDDVIEDVIALVEDLRHGGHRIMLLRALRASRRPEAREALERAALDPELEKEARIQLRALGRGKR